MCVLSEQHIKEHLGKDILVYPFHKDTSLRGCCLCLTASRYAYSIQQEKLLEIHKDPKTTDEYINIPPQETVLLWTNESIYISDRFCGSIHSKVGLVSKGIGHLGTRVNPNWSGVMCIALNNLFNQNIRINVPKKDIDKDHNDVGEIIAYLRIYKLTSKSLTASGLDYAGRLDAIPEGRPVPNELNYWINKDMKNKWRRGHKDTLENILKNSISYKEMKKELYGNSLFSRIEFIVRKSAPTLAATFLILIYLWINKKQDISSLMLVLIPLAYTIISEFIKDSN